MALTLSVPGGSGDNPLLGKPRASPVSLADVQKLAAGTRYLSPITSQVAVRGAADEAAASGFKAADLGAPSVSRATPPTPPSPPAPVVASTTSRYPASVANDEKFPPGPVAPTAPATAPTSAADFYGTPAAPLAGAAPPPGGVPPAYEPGGSMPAPPDTATIARHALGYRSYHGMPPAPGDADALNALSLQAAQQGRNYLPPGGGGVSALTLPPTANTPQGMLGHIADLRARGLISQDQASNFIRGAPSGMFGQPPNPLAQGGDLPLGQMIPQGSA